MKSFFSVMLVLLLAGLSAVSAQTAQTPAEICAKNVPAPEPATRQFAAPEQVLEPGVNYQAIFCTESGPVYVDLFEDYTPLTVNSFVFLAQNGYYNNTTFHRVLDGFMAQGGDPTGTGGGSPGYQFADEFVGFLQFDKPGWLAMANANRPEQGVVGTNGSQFFITTVPTPHLDYRHTIFGQVLEGQDNVEKLKLRDPQTNPNFPGATLDAVVIITDPAAVASSYVSPPPATQEEVGARFTMISDILPEDGSISVEKETAGLFTTEALVERAADSIRDSLQTYLTTHNHQFQVGAALLNNNCDFNNIGFIRLGYALDAFASRQDAAAALADTTLSQILLDNGFVFVEQSQNLGYPMYMTSAVACGVDAAHAVMYVQRGRFIATVEVTIPAVDFELTDRWLQLVMLRIFEPILAEVLRSELG